MGPLGSLTEVATKESRDSEPDDAQLDHTSVRSILLNAINVGVPSSGSDSQDTRRSGGNTACFKRRAHHLTSMICCVLTPSCRRDVGRRLFNGYEAPNSSWDCCSHPSLGLPSWCQELPAQAWMGVSAAVELSDGRWATHGLKSGSLADVLWVNHRSAVDECPHFARGPLPTDGAG